MFSISTQPTNNIKDILQPIDFVKSKKKRKEVYYGNVACSFDIEVSSFYKNYQKQATMYIYVLGINGKVKIGRTWNEFMLDIQQIIDYYELNSDKRLIIYVHNLQYEFQFIRKKFNWEEIFSLEQRRPIYARTVNGIEFRCSYILSQLSLAKVGEKLTKYKVQKLVGDLDYEKIRHSKTPISNKELQYVINDGLVVMAYIQELIESEGNINKLPLTNTGFVRNKCKENCVIGPSKWEYRQLIKKLTMTPENYTMLKQAYQGGFTHANGFRVNQTFKNVHSYDFASSYPSVLVSEKFPMSKGIDYVPKDKEDFEKCINTFCCLFTIKFDNLKSVFLYEQYISLSKCFEITEDRVINNGRVVEAKSLTTTITEVDFKIIKRVYKWSSIHIYNFTIFIKDYLPKDFILSILDLYRIKTTLKGVEGKEYEYLKGKNRLNSCYGMCVTDPCKDETTYDGTWGSQPNDLVKTLSSYNNSWSRFLFYPWGVWCTAYARYNLWSGILNIGKDYIYSDTDSLKVLNKEKHDSYFEQYNKIIVEKINNIMNHYNIDVNLIYPKNIKGETQVLGIWDYEGCYDNFKTLGAKRYILSKGTDLKITISGVDKILGSQYLLYEYKTIDNAIANFKEGLTFPGKYIVNENGKEIEKNGCGKMTHTYIDYKTEGYVIDYMGNTNHYEEDSCIHMETTSYNMSLSEDFKNYILNIKESYIC